MNQLPKRTTAALRRDKEDFGSGHYAGAHIILEATEMEKELSRATQMLTFLRSSCHIVYHDGEAGSYPIEHNPFANKDMWQALESIITPKSAASND